MNNLITPKELLKIETFHDVSIECYKTQNYLKNHQDLLDNENDIFTKIWLILLDMKGYLISIVKPKPSLLKFLRNNGVHFQAYFDAKNNNYKLMLIKYVNDNRGKSAFNMD